MNKEGKLTGCRAPVVVFYSFKGGTGRTLALVQLAAMLSRIGKRVCAIDLDLDAPSLETKFQLLGTAWQRNPQRGFVDLIYKYVRTASSEPSALHFFDEEDFAETWVARMPFGEAPIHVLKAGPLVENPDSYWATLYDEDVFDFILHGSEQETFFTSLLDTLQSSLEPDIILVDSRSGNNALARLCLAQLATKALFFTCHHVDGLTGTNDMLRRLIDKRPGIVGEDGVLIALSKIPSAFRNDAKGARVSRPSEDVKEVFPLASSCINSGLSSEFEPLFPLALEPSLAFEEVLPIPLRRDANPLNSHLVYDLVNLFAALLHNEVPDFAEQIHRYIAGVRIPRVYMLVESEGKMINPEDNSWNVALRVDTITTIMGVLFEDIIALYESIVDMKQAAGMPVADAHDSARHALFRTGELAARKFSRWLKDSWEKREASDRLMLDVKSRLDSWCRFDSTVGFGALSHTMPTAKEPGSIVLHNNFLLFERTPADENLCDFLSGYMHSVLCTIFPGSSIRVEHDLRKHCGQYRREGARDCLFQYWIGPGMRGKSAESIAQQASDQLDGK